MDIAAVDLFCGVAGLSLGLQRSGIRVIAGVDVDSACRFPFEENIGAEFIEQDVATLKGSTVAALFGRTAVRVLAGCAPCQPFSGYTVKRRQADDRWLLLMEFLRIARDLSPEIVTMENVPRLALLPLWRDFLQDLKEVGYHTAWGIVDVSQFGVPQRRRRLVLLASRLGPISLPKPVGSSRGATVRAAIGALPSIGAGQPNAIDPLHSARALSARNLERIKQSRPAGTWREWPEDLRASCHRSAQGKTYPSVYGRMSWDAPAPTMTTQFYGFGNGRFGHPDQDRAITLREGALLQSFPKSFKFVSKGQRVNFRQIGRLIGNAVPPRLAAAIGMAIVEHVQGIR